MIALACRVGGSESHVCMLWRICMNDPKDRLFTHPNLFAWRYRYVPYHFHLSARWGLVDLNDVSEI